MLTDIALCQGAINGVSDRMHANICIGMAEQTKFMGQGDTAECDLCSRSKFMDVKPVAQA